MMAILVYMLVVSRVAGFFATDRRRAASPLTASLDHSSSTTTDSCMSPDIISSLASSIVCPPEPLQALSIGETWYPIESTPLAITRVAAVPDVFVLRNFLFFEEDRHAIMELASMVGLEYAETKSGQVVHRKNSHLAWIPQRQDNAAEEIDMSAGMDVAQHMTQLASHLFLNEEEVDWYEAENLQVVRYSRNGKFDLHHDGFGRILTVLTYLNDVGGTWFPYARNNVEDYVDDNDVPPPKMTLEGKDMTEGKVPGKDGVLVAGSEASNDFLESCDPNKVVCINPGDSVVFYNYDWLENGVIKDSNSGEECDEPQTGAIMDWRAVHAGMPTNGEKWIATNWFRSELVTDNLLS